MKQKLKLTIVLLGLALCGTHKATAQTAVDAIDWSQYATTVDKVLSTDGGTPTYVLLYNKTAAATVGASNAFLTNGGDYGMMGTLSSVGNRFFITKPEDTFDDSENVYRLRSNMTNEEMGGNFFSAETFDDGTTLYMDRGPKNNDNNTVEDSKMSHPNWVFTYNSTNSTYTLTNKSQSTAHVYYNTDMGLVNFTTESNSSQTADEWYIITAESYHNAIKALAKDRYVEVSGLLADANFDRLNDDESQWKSSTEQTEITDVLGVNSGQTKEVYKYYNHVIGADVFGTHMYDLTDWQTSPWNLIKAYGKDYCAGIWDNSSLTNKVENLPAGTYRISCTAFNTGSNLNDASFVVNNHKVPLPLLTDQTAFEDNKTQVKAKAAETLKTSTDLSLQGADIVAAGQLLAAKSDKYLVDYYVEITDDDVTNGNNYIEYGFSNDYKYPAPDGYKLVWHDEFNSGTELNSSDWTHEVQEAGWVNNELQTYVNHTSPNGTNVTEISDGKLKINCFKEGDKIYSGRVYAHQSEGWQNGYIEARIKLPSGKGTWPAFWMMPADVDWTKEQWPGCGEIDIMEEVGCVPNEVSSSLHADGHNHTNNTEVTHRMTIDKAEGEFHTYALKWTDSNITTYVDGQVQLSYDNDGTGKTNWPYSRPFYVILNLAWGGSWGGMNGVDESALPVTMEVDYVRVFQQEDADDEDTDTQSLNTDLLHPVFADNFRLFYTNPEYAAYLSANNTTEANIDKYAYERPVELYLRRDFTAGTWNAIVLPFDISLSNLASNFGDDVRLSVLEGINPDRPTQIRFVSTSTLKAGSIGLIYVPEGTQPFFAYDKDSKKELSVLSAAITDANNISTTTKQAAGPLYRIVGVTRSGDENGMANFESTVSGNCTTSAGTLDYTGYYYKPKKDGKDTPWSADSYIVEGGKMHHLTSEWGTVRGTMWQLKSADEAGAKTFTLEIDGVVEDETTLVEGVVADHHESLAPTYYNIGGQRVSRPHGLTIVRQADGTTRKTFVRN